MSTAVEIANQALVRIGAAPLSSFGEQDAQAVAVETIYRDTTRALIAGHVWAFAIRETVLPELVLLPSQRRIVYGEHIYQLPADNLRALGFRNFRYFEISGDQLYTNDERAQLLYVANVDESHWPEFFIKLVVLELAAALAIAVTDSSERSNQYIQLAARETPRAHALNSQQTPPVVYDLMRLYTRRRHNPLAGA